MSDYIALLIGIISAGAGGEFFVRGTVGTARALRISPGIIATTIAAFATSSPELTVSINSALQGTPRIALGDALGSNVDLRRVCVTLGQNCRTRPPADDKKTKG
jgi:cation:H+ antiporter